MKDLVFKTVMLKGEAGGTISSIEKTSSALNVDTYTISLNDGTTQTFEVTNGTSIASIEKTSSSGLIDTYTITFTDDTTATFEVQNGQDGAPGYEVPTGSVIYYDSSDEIPEGYEAVTLSPDWPDLLALYDLSREIEGSFSEKNTNVTIANFHMITKGRLVVVNFNFTCNSSVAAWDKLCKINKAPQDHIYALGLNMSTSADPDIRMQIKSNGEIMFAGTPLTNVIYNVNAVFSTAVS